MPKMNLK
jgi:translation initiation factor 5